jgi:phosphonopyruvate decarboxylase
LLDNEAHDSTGGQATVSANVAFAEIAAACGYRAAYSGDDIELIDALYNEPNPPGARFLHLKIRPGTLADLPRPDRTPAQVLDRFMKHIHSRF